MNLLSIVDLQSYGTSDGVRKAWDTRGRKEAVQVVGPKGSHTLAGAKELVRVLTEKVPGGRFAVIGSVMKKGQSTNDLDVKVTRGGAFRPNASMEEGEKFHSGLLSTMRELGFEYYGQGLVSPSEARAANKGGKQYPVRWSEYRLFKNLDTRQKVEFWF